MMLFIFYSKNEGKKRELLCVVVCSFTEEEKTSAFQRIRYVELMPDFSNR